MDSTRNQFDIFEIYGRYCDITSDTYACMEEGYRRDDESQKGKFSREALNQLLKSVESRMHPRMSIFDEIFKLMSTLDLMVDFVKFSRFYDFVFFICRENGQKDISVSRAVMSWRLVLAGRFRLLKQWCDFVEHNISGDTWRQVLAFSRCDPEGFVQVNIKPCLWSGLWHFKDACMQAYKEEVQGCFPFHFFSGNRIMGSIDKSNLFCSCGDSEAQPFEDSLPGLKIIPGLKRKIWEDFRSHELESSDKFAGPNLLLNSKKRHTSVAHKLVNPEENPRGNVSDECMEIVKHNGLLGCSKSSCAVEGCLSKGFAGLFSSRSYRERKVSYT